MLSNLRHEIFRKTNLLATTVSTNQVQSEAVRLDILSEDTYIYNYTAGKEDKKKWGHKY